MTKEKTVILSAGGTGGHVFPARALADELIKRGFAVAVCTDTRGLKYFDGMNADIPRHIISSGTYSAGLKGKMIFALSLVKGFFQSVKIVRHYKPMAMVGFGGYPSVPPLFAGQLFGVPTILHEQNAILGLANKLLLSRAKKVACSYAETVGLRGSDKVVVTGNPVRADIAALGQSDYPSLENKITVMVVGGSQGAKVFSDIVPQAFVRLPDTIKSRLNIIQQSRPDAADTVRKLYQAAGLQAEVKSFFDDMPERIKTAHLFITRSGASTVAELTAAGRPAVYVPFPFNRDNQQVYNAEQVAKVGGGWVMLEKDLTADNLKNLLEDLLSNPQKLSDAATAAKTQGRGDAAVRLADVVSNSVKISTNV